MTMSIVGQAHIYNMNIIMVLLKTGVSLSIYTYHIKHSYIYFMDRNMFGMNCHEYVKTTEQCVVDKVYAVKSLFLHRFIGL